MKKIISIVLAVLLLVFMVLPAAASETARASGDCGEGLTWSLSDDGTLTVSGSGEMAEGSPWEDYRSDRRLPEGDRREGLPVLRRSDFHPSACHVPQV